MSDDDAFQQAIEALEKLRGKVPGIEAQIEQLRSHRAGAIATAPAAPAIAGDHGKAAAQRSVAAETIAHSVVVTGHVEGGIYLGPRPHDAVEALTAYRRVLVSSARHLPLRGVDVGAADPSRTQQRFELTSVYIDLQTRLRQVDLPAQLGQLTLVKTEQPVLHAVAANRRLVLLGDPGSGKSTFLHHLLLCLAAHGLDPEQGWLERLPGWLADEADLVPIPVLLRDFARSLPRERADSGANPLLLWRFLENRLAEQKLEAVGDALHDALDRGRAILLLDGLDEVPTSEERSRVRAIVEAIARRYPAARLLVTCRTLSYQDPAWQLDGLLSAELVPFDEPRIDRFVAAWYAELRRMGILRPDEAGPLASALREAVRRKDLWRLAPNPLLLTVMALIHTHKGRLPDARARLYEDTVDLLLWRWDELRTAGAGQELGLRKLLRDANCQDVDLHRTLWQLAYEAHAQADAGEGEVLADIAEHRLETALAHLHPRKSRDWAMQIIEVMKLRAGLLLERSPGVYTFPHRTFQEYLAGAYLAARANFATEASRLDVTQWREVILLAVGRLVYVHLEIDRPLLLALALCGDERAGGEADLHRASFAADVLLEIGIDRVLQVPQGMETIDRVRRRLVAIIADRAVPASLRILAGDRLGRIGDPRFDPERFWLPADPMHGFIEIPAGSYEVPTARLLHDALVQVETKVRSPAVTFLTFAVEEMRLMSHWDPDRLQANLRQVYSRFLRYARAPSYEPDLAERLFEEPWAAPRARPDHLPGLLRVHSQFHGYAWALFDEPDPLERLFRELRTESMYRSGRLQAGLLRTCLRLHGYGRDLSDEPDLVARLIGELRAEPDDRAIFIARYPVTEAQFDAYLAHAGRAPARSARRGKNYPVVDVSFQDALDYCAWLAPRLAAGPSSSLRRLLATGWRLLPCSRDEWEKALFVGSRGSLFPWGNEARAGASSSGIGAIAPVGVFPAARTGDGVDDLIGNVWESMRDHGGRTSSGGGASTQLESLFEMRTSDRFHTGFRLVLTREPWPPPEPAPYPVRAALPRP
jgi:hypothetical protein